MKNFFAITLVLSIILALCPLGAFAETTSGTCGENLTWTFDSETGVLTISGEGEMDRYSLSSPAPWLTHKNLILSVVVEENVTEISEYAFTSYANYDLNGCENLVSVSLPDSIAKIGKYAFAGCAKLTSINIPEGIDRIEDYVFSSCASLKSINLPQSVAAIGKCAFYGCKKLTSINIPENVIEIKEYAFDWCEDLNSVHITDMSSWLGISFDAFCANPLSYGADLYMNGEKITELSIPDDITQINAYAFHGCGSITSVDSLGNVTTIGEQAFSVCTNLTSVNISEGVVEIAESAFYNCKNLNYIRIPDGVSAIAPRTFYGCASLSTIVIPKSVTEIKGAAFYYCSNLTTVIYLGTEEDWNAIVFGGNNDVLIAAYETNICDHEWIDMVIDSTCTEGGYTDHICESCDVSYVSDEKEALGHVEGEWLTLDDGSKELRCEVCNELLDSEAAPLVRGDVNGDGNVNMFDYTVVKAHYFGKNELAGELMERADLTGDSKIDMFDYMVLKTLVFGK